MISIGASCAAAREPIAVEPQVFDLLVYLVQNRDRVVSKDDLIASVWGGRIVSESTLTSRINAARKAIGDSGKEQRLIRTIARKGFRFVGDVQTQPDDGQPTTAAEAPPDEIHEPPRAALPLPDRPAIAVLPFTNMSGDPEQEYFSDGISEDIITALSKLRWFFVIARNSSFIYKGKAVHMKQVAEELGVGYVVEGSVRKGGDRVRITAQLNDVATGSHIWAERYDRDLADVFAVQDEITEAIVAAIEPQLYAAENFRARRKPPDSMDAWDLVMRALSHYWRVTRQDNVVAQALLEKAIAIDPNYGQALGVLATSHIVRRPYGLGGHGDGGADRRARGAGGDPGRQRGPLGAPRARLRLSVRAALRRLAGRVRTGAAAQSELLAGAGLLRPGAVLLRALAGRRRGGAARAAAQSARSASRRSITASPPTPSSSAATTTRRCGCRARRIRQRGDFVGAHRVLTAAAGMAGQIEVASRAAGASPRAAQYLARLDRQRNAVARRADREHYLEGLRRAGLE